MQLEESKCDVWLKELSVGLTDIFSSKIDPTRRELALRLSAVLSQVFGMEWGIRNGPKFLLLWLHLVVVVSKGLIRNATRTACMCFPSTCMYM